MADVPLRDAAQALLDAVWPSSLPCPECKRIPGHLDGCKIGALRAALAAADTAPTCPGSGQERVTSPGGYDPPGPEGMCPVCEEIVPVDDGLVEDHSAADDTTPTQPDEVLWEGPLGELVASLYGPILSALLDWFSPDDARTHRVRIVAAPATRDQP